VVREGGEWRNTGTVKKINKSQQERQKKRHRFSGGVSFIVNKIILVPVAEGVIYKRL
jgi:hypothetical protein